MVSLPEILHGVGEEKIPIAEHPVSPEIKPELEGYVEKVEKEVELQQPVTHHGQILVTSPTAQKIKIVLPLTKTQIEWGLHQKISTAVRWLAEWCLRVIKKGAELGAQVLYPQKTLP